MPSRNGKKTIPASVPPPLHELEAEVMEELWRSGEAPVRAVMEALNKSASPERAYTTYMTIMARLHKKGLLVRRREGKTDFYARAWAARSIWR
jgi:predicted transcriptional regulator